MMTPRRTAHKIPASRANQNQNSNRDAIPTSRANQNQNSKRDAVADNDDDDFVNPHLSKKQNGAQANKKANADVGTSTRNTPKSASKRGRPAKKKARIEEGEDVVEVKGKSYCTMRCSPKSIATIVKGMTEEMKKRVQKIGFGEILKFAFDAIGDRDLAMFLMANVKFDPLRIVVGEKVLPLNADVFHCVLGLPIGGDPLPILSSADRSGYQSQLRSDCDKNGMKALHTERQKKIPKTKKYEALKPHEVPRWVVEEFASRKNHEDWTLRCFLMTLFNALLFPSSNLEVLGQEYFYCLDLDKVGKYDWCGAVIDDFTDKVSKFQSGGKRATPSVQGCIVVPLIYYLDSLYFPPHNLNDLSLRPRAAFFHGSVVEIIEKADRKFCADGRTKTYGKLPLRDKALTCYETIRDSANTDVPVVQVSLVANVQKGESLVSEGKDMMKEAHFKLESGERMVFEGKAMMKEGHLKVVSEVSRIIGLCVRPVEHSVHVAHDGGHDFQDHSNVRTPISSSIHHTARTAGDASWDRPELDCSREPIGQGNVSKTVDVATPVDQDGSMESPEADPLHEPIGQGNVSKTGDVATPVDKDGSIESPEGDPLHGPIGQGNISKTGDVATPVDKDGSMESPESNPLHGPIGQGKVSKTGDVSTPVDKDGSMESPEGDPLHEAIGQGNASKLVDVATPVDKDASMEPPGADPLHIGQGNVPKTAEVAMPADKDVSMTPRDTATLHAPSNSWGGVPANSFDWDGWNDVTSVLREINETQSCVAEISEPDLAGNVEMPDIEAEAVVVEQNPIENVEMLEANQRPAVTYRRKTRGKKKNKDLPLLYQIPVELGLPVVQFQLANHVTTRANKFTSPFKAPMVRRDPPDVDKSMKLRDIVVDCAKKLENVMIFRTKSEYRSQDIDCCISFTRSVADSFGDNKMIQGIFIHFFSLCLLNDEKEARPTSAGYRLFLPGTLSNTILYEQYNTGSQYSMDAALSFFVERYSVDDLLDAKLILFPVVHLNHWTVYCVNLVHGQIDILDPYPWKSEKEQMEYHGSIAARIRGRLHELLNSLTDGDFPDISGWSLPFIEVPKQSHDNDSGCFAMLFLEHYDGENRKMDITIHPELVSQYRAQMLYYMAFHKINLQRPFPDDIERLAPVRLESVHMAALDDD